MTGSAYFQISSKVCWKLKFIELSPAKSLLTPQPAFITAKRFFEACFIKSDIALLLVVYVCSNPISLEPQTDALKVKKQCMGGKFGRLSFRQ